MAGFEIYLKPSAVKDMDRLRKYDAVMVADGMEIHLSQNPTKESKSRIKRLRGISNPDYRLRLGDFRAFHNVDNVKHAVDVLRILHKDQTLRYYEEVQK